MKNELGSSQSVYLQQHAGNPVAWQQWNASTLELAKTKNLPLFVSVGYSTCHWCHVMEKECFEDEEVAAALNRGFVPVKVDREELPHVDTYLMNALMAMSGRGGWPLNVFLNGKLQPFFGATYFPKKNFLEVLSGIRDFWEKSPNSALDQGAKVHAHITAEIAAHENTFSLESFREQWRSWLGEYVNIQHDNFDADWGGFGPAPKFPRAHAYLALQVARRANSVGKTEFKQLDSMLELSLRAMAHGGLWDPLEGGFHRYSTDEKWWVPHFEKMTYDQALLLRAYAAEAVISGRNLERDVCVDLLSYLENRMRLESGFFAAAEDADSEGVEGKFYTWSPDELETFNKNTSSKFLKFFDLYSLKTPPDLEGRHVLKMALSSAWDEGRGSEAEAFKKAFKEFRDGRERPIRDPKAIASWNAWMATALLDAARVLQYRDTQLADRMLMAGAKTVAALLRRAGPTQSLARLDYASSSTPLYFEDYAAMIEAIQFLGIAKSDLKSFQLAAEWIEVCESNFKTLEGEWRASTADDLPVDAQRVELQDGATPSTLSVYCGVLFRQALFGGDAKCLEKALELARKLRPLLDRFPVAGSYFLSQAELCEAAVIKFPVSKRSELAKMQSDLGVDSSRYYLMAHSGDNFQVCDLNSCFLRAQDWHELLRSIKSR